MAGQQPGGPQLADQETHTDLTNYLARAAKVADPEAAVRLQQAGHALAVWVPVLPPVDLSLHQVVIGLRVFETVDAPAEPLDAVVPLAAVRDRLARSENGRRVPVPPQQVAAGWAAVSPPRGPWEPVGEVSVDLLNTVAAQGISEVAQGSPEGSGSAAVAGLRARVWGRPLEDGPEGVTAGVAFGAFALGFLVGEAAQVRTSGRWVRVSTAAGHVLTR